MAETLVHNEVTISIAWEYVMIRKLLWLAFVAVPLTAVAADYPTKPITIILPGPPGGGTDTLARQLAVEVQGILGQRLVVENKAGAGGALGVTVLTQARPDGYTLAFVHNGPLTTLPNTMSVTYTQDSYRPIVEIGYSSYIMCVHPDFPANDAKGFLKELHDHPGKYSYGNDGVGGTMNLAAEQIFRKFDITATAVPFGGAGETARNFLGNHVDIYGGSLQAITAQMAAGKAKCLLLTSADDNPAAPQASGLNALGIGEMSAGLWWGLIGPKTLPDDISKTLQDAFTQAAKTQRVQDALKAINAEPVIRGPDEYRALIKHESDGFAATAQQMGLKK
jgi:tripartite-type tricarboxylate transporter receptor subunit TctC